MTVINTNVAASITANALTKNERAMHQAMERLSTGQRINSASDDAAGKRATSGYIGAARGLLHEDPRSARVCRLPRQADDHHRHVKPAGPRQAIESR